MTDPVKNVPLKLWSHPFRFIFLPWILVFFVIFYWFSFVPLLFAYYIKKSNPETAGKYVFLLIHLVIFILMVSFLVYVWKKNPGTEEKDYCSIKRLEEGLDVCDDLVDVPEVAERRPMLTLDLGNQEDVCVRPHATYDDQRPLSQNLEVALTPRELFFRDLYEKVFETDSTITRDFIQKEREYSSIDLEAAAGSLHSVTPNDLRHKPSSSANKSFSDMPRDAKYLKNSLDETKSDEEERVAEFFVANITEKKSVTSEVFLYVCDEGEKPEKFMTKVCVRSAEDDVFLE